MDSIRGTRKSGRNRPVITMSVSPQPEFNPPPRRGRLIPFFQRRIKREPAWGRYWATSEQIARLTTEQNLSGRRLRVGLRVAQAQDDVELSGKSIVRVHNGKVVTSRVTTVRPHVRASAAMAESRVVREFQKLLPRSANISAAYSPQNFGLGRRRAAQHHDSLPEKTDAPQQFDRRLPTKTMHTVMQFAKKWISESAPSSACAPSQAGTPGLGRGFTFFFRKRRWCPEPGHWPR